MDGLWIDMNEPSNFCNGACDKSNTSTGRQSLDFDPVDPPYYINNRGSKYPLYTKTLDMDAQHFDQVAYDVHNLYGELSQGGVHIRIYGGNMPVGN